MPAEVEPIGWSAYCEDCDWESTQYSYKRAADKLAEQHNTEYHKEDQ